MYVKKFEGDTLDEAVQAVKRELGPDAIILKTVTNKGLKGAFKKNRIEITAAISEESYGKKSRVDHVLSDQQKDQFYNSPSSSINNMINNYDTHSAKPVSAAPGYGGMGLNKVVSSVASATAKASSKIKNSLDDFLATEEVEEPKEFVPRNISTEPVEESFVESDFERTYAQELEHTPEPVFTAPVSSASTELALELKQQLKSQSNQIELLEKKLLELSQNLTVQSEYSSEHKGLKELRTTLKTLDLSDSIIQGIVKKAMFELSKEDLEDPDVIYDFALRELNSSINTALPLFSSIEVQGKPVVTVLMSEAASGQSSMALKLAVLKENVKIIKFRTHAIDHNSNQFAAQVFKLDIVNVDSLSSIMSEARKAMAEGKSIILDIKPNGKDEDETKKIIGTLDRSFDQIEFLVTISAINSEMYNRKILSKYKKFADGIIISYVDQCLNFGALVNVHHANIDIPLKFYGIGTTVPDDIEAASAERILAGMFEL